MEKDFSHLDIMEDFIGAVALDCIAEMSEEDKETILNNPDTSLYHFGYCIYIRNTYINPYKLRFPVFMMDSLSASIIEKIIALL